MISIGGSKLLATLHIIHLLVWRPQVPLVILWLYWFKTFPKFLFGQQISSHNLNTHWCGLHVRCHMVSALTTNSRTRRWRQWLVIVINRRKILDINLLYMLCTLEFVGSLNRNLGQPHACVFWIQGREQLGKTHTFKETQLNPSSLQLTLRLLSISKNTSFNKHHFIVVLWCNWIVVHLWISRLALSY